MLDKQVREMLVKSMRDRIEKVFDNIEKNLEPHIYLLIGVHKKSINLSLNDIMYKKIKSSPLFEDLVLDEIGRALISNLQEIFQMLISDSYTKDLLELLDILDDESSSAFKTRWSLLSDKVTEKLVRFDDIFKNVKQSIWGI